jgi:sugar lactone lactonase YvrE
MNKSSRSRSHANALLLPVMLLLGVAAHAQTPFVYPLSATPQSPTYNEGVSASVLVRDETSLAPLTGTVNFTVDGGSPISGTLNGEGFAYANLGQLSVGSHTVTATFNGNGSYPSGSAKPLMVAVTDAPLAFVGTQGTTLFGDGSVSDVEGVAVDPQDNLYIADKAQNLVREETTSGNLITVPLTGLKSPIGLAFDNSGNLYVADSGNNRILKYNPAGTQTVVPVIGLSAPTYLAYDRNNDVLYIVDPGNSRIASFTIAGGATTNVVTGMTGLRGVAVNNQGDIFFSDRNAGFIEINSDGQQIPIFGAISEPGGITTNVGNYLILSDVSTNTVLRYDNSIDASDQGNQIQINNSGNPVIGMASDSAGRVYLALGGRVDVLAPGSGRVPDVPEYANSIFNLIFRSPRAGATFSSSPTPASIFSGSGGVSCTGGTGGCSLSLNFSPQTAGINTGWFNITQSYDEGDVLLWGKGIGGSPAFTPGFSSQTGSGVGAIGGVALDLSGNHYVSDTQNNQVIKISPTGTSTTLAFTGLSSPTQVAVDATGAVYVFDSGNDQIERLSNDGVQSTTYAPTGERNGPNPISAFSLDGDGNLLVAGLGQGETNSAKVQRHSKPQPNAGGGQYVIYFFANDFPADKMKTNLSIGSELSGEEVASSLPQVTAVAIDAEKNVYSVDTSGTLSRFGVDGSIQQLATNLSSPIGLLVDASSSAYVLGNNSIITLVHPDGSTAKIVVNALYTPAAFALDPYGNILIGDGADKQLIYLDRTQQNYVFGDVNVGESSTLDGSISNIGNQPFTFSGPLPANVNFVQTIPPNACVAPLNSTPGTSLAPAASCDLGYSFAPKSPGPFSDSGTLSTSPTTLIGSSGGGAIQLSGTGVGSESGPQPVLTPAMINFGSVALGSTSAMQTATLTNTGGVPQGISSFGFFGTNASSFSETNTCGSSLAAGASCTIALTCSPTTADSLAANLGANFPSPQPQLSIALTCAGAAATPPPAPGAALTPATADFGSMTSGTTSTARTFTLTNPGNAVLTITGVTLGGSNLSDFAISANTCGGTLAASATCTVSVTFTPAAVGSFAASLSIADNASGSPQTSSLTGFGTIPADFTITVSPASQTVSAGAAAAYSVSITSADGSFTNPVALTATGLPPGATVTFSPATVTPGSSAAQSSMSIQTTTQRAATRKHPEPWPFAAPVFTCLLMLLPSRRFRHGKTRRKFFTNLACIIALLGVGISAIGCGGGFALPSTAKTYTITVTGTSGSDNHSTTVTLTVQ